VNLLRLLFTLVVYAGEIVPPGNIPKVGLKVLRSVVSDYYLLSANKPAEFKVTGIPDSGAWLRVYSRLWFENNAKPGEKGIYVLRFIQGKTEQQFHLQTQVSTSTRGPAGQPIGKWRSFYVHLLPGGDHFQLILDSASTDTVGVRFRFQLPRLWEQVKIPNASPMTLVYQTESIAIRKTGYFKLETGKPVNILVSGPGQLRLRFRIDYDPGMTGPQSFIVEVSENNNQLVNRTFRTKKDKTVRYLENAEVIPSTERSLSFQLSEGEHRLGVIIKGTLAKSAVLAIDRLPGEKYE
jgi:hypothetical protein